MLDVVLGKPALFVYQLVKCLWKKKKIYIPQRSLSLKKLSLIVDILKVQFFLF